jgi:hypothetical protein
MQATKNREIRENERKFMEKRGNQAEISLEPGKNIRIRRARPSTLQRRETVYKKKQGK